MIEDNDILKNLKRKKTRNTAFNQIVEKYNQKVYWHIRNILIDHEDTNDVTQNTFIKVWKNLDKFRGDSSIFSWIYRIATNESLNFIRKNKKHQQALSMDTAQDYLEAQIDKSPELNGDEIQKKLFKAVAKLPEKQRLIFSMKYFQDMKYTEISEVLDQSVGGLKANYHHAVKKIEETLKNSD